MLQLYVHQNYTPFCNTIEECSELIEGISFADAQLKPHTEGVSRYARLFVRMHEADPADSSQWHEHLTSHYTFLYFVRNTLLSLPSPVERRGQGQTKSAWFAARQRTKEVAEYVADSSTWLHSSAAGGVRGGDATSLGAQGRSGAEGEQVVTETLPLLCKIASARLSSE